MTELSDRIDVGSFVAAGGFTGAIGRYGVDVVVGSTLEATLLVNVVGSFTLAVVLAGVLEGRRSHRLRRFLATGFLSSFTTYSTFVVTTIRHDPPVAIGYVLATYVAGFVAAAIGLVLVERRRNRQ